MTRRFNAHFKNGVLVPDEVVDLPEGQVLSVVVDEEPVMPARGATPRHDDPNDPRPEGGVELVEWWARHRLQAPPGVTDKIARSKYYEYYEEEPDDNAG